MANHFLAVMGENIKQAIHQYYDNSLENIGSWNSYTWYVMEYLAPFGIRSNCNLNQARPSLGPSINCPVKIVQMLSIPRRHSSSLHRQTPANAFLPSFTHGSFNRSFTTVMDFAPTFLEMAGVKMPPATTKKIAASPRNDAVTRQMTTFRGRDVHTIRGKSWLPYFARGQKVEEDDMWTIYSSNELVG